MASGSPGQPRPFKWKSDLTGKRIGRLMVEGPVGVGGKWFARCDCGKKTTATGANLRKGATRSCGCQQGAVQARDAKEPAPVRGARWIPLTRGLFALVSACDFERLARFRWHATKRPYAVSRLDGAREVPMHELVAGVRAPDHKNGNTLDNRRRNLRRASHRQNCRNRKTPSTNKSGYKGVSRVPGKAHWTPRWTAQISWRIRGKHRVHYLGRFGTPEAAARAYNVAARKYFGRFARLNKIPRAA